MPVLPSLNSSLYSTQVTTPAKVFDQKSGDLLKGVLANIARYAIAVVEHVSKFVALDSQHTPDNQWNHWPQISGTYWQHQPNAGHAGKSLHSIKSRQTNGNEESLEASLAQSNCGVLTWKRSDPLMSKIKTRIDALKGETKRPSCRDTEIEGWLKKFDGLRKFEELERLLKPSDGDADPQRVYYILLKEAEALRNLYHLDKESFDDRKDLGHELHKFERGSKEASAFRISVRDKSIILVSLDRNLGIKRIERRKDDRNQEDKIILEPLAKGQDLTKGAKLTLESATGESLTKEVGGLELTQALAAPTTVLEGSRVDPPHDDEIPLFAVMKKIKKADEEGTSVTGTSTSSSLFDNL